MRGDPRVPGTATPGAGRPGRGPAASGRIQLVHYLVNRNKVLRSLHVFFEMIYWLILLEYATQLASNYGKPSINIHLPAASFLHLPAPARGALSPQQLLRVIGQLRHHHRLHVVVEGREG